MSTLTDISPVAAVALEDSNLENLRTMAHRDKEGNVISKPEH